MAKKKANGHDGPKLYKAYWFRGQDPMINEVKAEVQRTIGNQRITSKKLREMEKAGGPSVTCMDNWFSRKTQRPQHATLAAALGSLGLKMKIVKDG